MPQRFSFFELWLSRIRPGLSFRRSLMSVTAVKTLARKTMTPKTRRLMSILSLIFLSLFLLSLSLVLFSLPLERRDVWLKVISVLLAGATVMVGFWAFITG